VSKGAIIAALLGLATIVLVFAVVPGMQDGGYVIRAYVITAVILAVYTWSLANRVDKAEKGRDARQGVTP
jgi:hypothetical protein